MIASYTEVYRGSGTYTNPIGEYFGIIVCSCTHRPAGCTHFSGERTGRVLSGGPYPWVLQPHSHSGCGPAMLWCQWTGHRMSKLMWQFLWVLLSTSGLPYFCLSELEQRFMSPGVIYDGPGQFYWSWCTGVQFWFCWNDREYPQPFASYRKHTLACELTHYTLISKLSLYS